MGDTLPRCASASFKACKTLVLGFKVRSFEMTVIDVPGRQKWGKNKAYLC